MRPRFFATPEAFRAWLEEHHASSDELDVGFYKRATGKPSMTWTQAVDEALAFGWIDGVRHKLDEARYTVRFTPRRAGSVWSAVNIARVKQLAGEGRMRPSGLRAFASADEAAARRAHEERHAATLDPGSERIFRAAPRAWSFFEAQPPSYRKLAITWVTTAKKPETRAKRLATLISLSGRQQRLDPLAPGRS